MLKYLFFSAKRDRPCRNPDFAGVEAVQAKNCSSPTQFERALAH
jgi:hypothetical protein